MLFVSVLFDFTLTVRGYSDRWNTWIRLPKELRGYTSTTDVQLASIVP